MELRPWFSPPPQQHQEQREKKSPSPSVLCSHQAGGGGEGEGGFPLPLWEGKEFRLLGRSSPLTWFCWEEFPSAHLQTHTPPCVLLCTRRDFFGPPLAWLGQERQGRGWGRGELSALCMANHAHGPMFSSWENSHVIVQIISTRGFILWPQEILSMGKRDNQLGMAKAT